MTDHDRRTAIRRIRAKRGFAVHASFYVVINVVLVGIWAVTWTGYFWPGWVLFGWGIGLVAHGLVVRGWHRPISEERIQAELARIR